MSFTPPHVIWLFGHQSSGKSTLATTLRGVLRAEKRIVCLLDEETFRSGVSQDLGHTPGEVMLHLQRAAHTAALLASQGQTIIAAFPLPEQAQREAVQRILGDRLLLVHLTNDEQEPSVLLDESTGLTRVQTALKNLGAPVNLTLNVSQLNVSECVRRLRDQLMSPEPEKAAAIPVPAARRPEDGPTDPKRIRRKRTVDEVRDRHLRQVGILAVASVILFTVFFLILREMRGEIKIRPQPETLTTADEPATQRPALKAPEPVKDATFEVKSAAAVEPKPEEQAHMVNYMPPDAVTIQAACEATMAAFWKTTDWKAKLRYVRSPDRVSPLMQNYYEGHHHEEPAVGALNTCTFQRHGSTRIVTLNYAGTGIGKRVSVILITQTGDPYLIDWEFYTGSGDMDWADFKQQHPTEPKLFRGYLTEDNYFNYEFADNTRFASYHIESVDGLQSVNAFCEKGSDLADRLYGLSQRTGGAKVPVAVQLAFPEQAKSDHCVKLSALIADRWLLLD